MCVCVCVWSATCTTEALCRCVLKRFRPPDPDTTSTPTTDQHASPREHIHETQNQKRKPNNNNNNATRGNPLIGVVPDTVSVYCTKPACGLDPPIPKENCNRPKFSNNCKYTAGSKIHHSCNQFRSSATRLLSSHTLDPRSGRPLSRGRVCGPDAPSRRSRRRSCRACLLSE